MGAVSHAESQDSGSGVPGLGRVIQLFPKRARGDSIRDERNIPGTETVSVSAQDSTPETTLRKQLGDWESVQLVITGHPDSIAETCQRIRQSGINTPDLAANTAWLVVTMPARLALSLCWWILDHPFRTAAAGIVIAAAAIAA